MCGVHNEEPCDGGGCKEPTDHQYEEHSGTLQELHREKVQVSVGGECGTNEVPCVAYCVY